MADTPEAIRKSIRTYLIIGTILFCGTIATVLVATVPAFDVGHHGFDMADCKLGLAIATFKAACVAAVFMHLNHEKKAIYWIFGGGIMCACFLYFLTALAKSDPIHDNLFYGADTKAPAPLASPTLR
jgi:cytochrome c oxidase subunit IV